MSVLITGAGGFIGSHLVEECVRQGRRVKAMCHYKSNNSSGWLEKIEKNVLNEVEIIWGDVRDPFFINGATKGVKTIYHLAALIGIPYSYQAAKSYVDTNVNGTLNILEAAKSNEVENLIITSTSETYGSAKYVPIDEKHPMVGQSPYSATKIAADQLAISYHKSFDLPLSIIRPFNTYGPRQSNRAVIPTIINQIANGQIKINLGNISTTRDFNYVSDTCRAFTEIEKAQIRGCILNACSNFEISIGDTVNLIGEIMGKKVEIVQVEERIRPENSEVDRLYGDNKLIKEKTKWKPLYEGTNGFRKGLEKTIEWFLANKEVYAEQYGRYIK